MSLLQMSFSGAVLITAIVMIRFVAINRLPKKTFLILWFIALFRLLVPVSIPSVFSVYSAFSRNASSQTLQSVPVSTFMPVSTSATLTAASSGSGFNTVTASAEHSVSLWAVAWIIGCILCGLYFLLSYIRCYREFQTSLPVHDTFTDHFLQTHPLKRHIQVRYSDRITAPLTYGLIHPVILMPKNTDWSETDHLQYVYTHEYIHIRRFDTLSKILCVMAVCIHWFNPFVWLMYFLFNRDIEMNCDESVIHEMGEQSKTSYARMLVTMQARRSGLMPLCNHFSKTAIEERTRAIMKTKKASIFTILTAAVLVAGLTTACATSATKESDTQKNDTNTTQPEQATSDVIMPVNSLTSAEDALANGSYSVYFSSGDLADNNGKSELTVEVYEYDRYSKESIDNMKIGDQIQSCQNVIDIESMEESDNGNVIINGGIEQDGIELTKEDDHYRTVTFDDYPIYYSVGTITIPVSDTVSLEDHINQDNEPNGVLSSGTEALQAIKDSETDFASGSTTITVKDGEIVQILRRWVP